jgi:hypothetical protein
MQNLLFILLLIAVVAALFFTPAAGSPAEWGAIHGAHIPPEQPGDWK